VLISSGRVKGIDLSEIYSENVVAKVLQVAQRGWRLQVCGEESHFWIRDADGA
jgi:hypothetical protein